MNNLNYEREHAENIYGWINECWSLEELETILDTIDRYSNLGLISDKISNFLLDELGDRLNTLFLIGRK